MNIQAFIRTFLLLLLLFGVFILISIKNIQTRNRSKTEVHDPWKMPSLMLEIYNIIKISHLKKGETLEVLLRKLEVCLLILELRRYLKIPGGIMLNIFFGLPDTDKYKDSPEKPKVILGFCRLGTKDRVGEIKSLDIYFNDILFRSISAREVRFRVACHEMIHVLQAIDGRLSYTFLDIPVGPELVENKTTPLWEGSVIYDWLMKTSDLPWEREAYLRDKELAQVFLKDYSDDRVGIVRLLIAAFKYWKRS